MQSGIYAAPGAAILVAGATAQCVAPAAVVGAAAGALGAATATTLTLSSRATVVRAAAR